MLALLVLGGSVLSIYLRRFEQALFMRFRPTTPTHLRLDAQGRAALLI